MEEKSLREGQRDASQVQLDCVKELDSANNQKKWGVESLLQPHSGSSLQTASFDPAKTCRTVSQGGCVALNYEMRINCDGNHKTILARLRVLNNPHL